MSEQDNSPAPIEDADVWAKLFAYRNRPLADDIVASFFQKNHKKPNPIPFLKVDDLNNKNKQDEIDCNPPKRAIVAGLKWEF